jgi:hypothetical protein
MSKSFFDDVITRNACCAIDADRSFKKLPVCAMLSTLQAISNVRDLLLIEVNSTLVFREGRLTCAQAYQVFNYQEAIIR